MGLPYSDVQNLGSKEDRLEELVDGIHHMATEMLVLMPFMACNCLGKDFFGDIISFKDSPSIRALNKSHVFDQLSDTDARLKVLCFKS